MINVKFPFIRKFVRKGCRQLFLKLGRTNHLYNFLYPTSIVFSLKKIVNIIGHVRKKQNGFLCFTVVGKVVIIRSNHSEELYSALNLASDLL